jgi:diguanylate cyclase (GGDEF)-like protein
MQIDIQRIFAAGKLIRGHNMKTNPGMQVPKEVKSSRSLNNVLDQSEHIKDLVVEAAVELSSVNAVLKQGLTVRAPLPGVENAIEKSEAVEGKVQDASAKLSLVNLALKTEVTKRHVLEAQLAAVTEQGEADHHAAFHDALTDLPNRALFNDRLEYGLAQAARHGWTLAVMFADLDDFKIINDTHGHDVGDSVLQIISGRLQENSRSEDTVSRLGGDEFLCLLMEVGDERDASLIAQKIIKSVQTPCNVNKPGFALSLTVKASIGIALFPKNGTTAQVLIESADKAMYEAKRTKSGYYFAR